MTPDMLRAMPESDCLRVLAKWVGDLSPDWNRPTRFYERRDDIAEALRGLATRLDEALRPEGVR